MCVACACGVVKPKAHSTPPATTPDAAHHARAPNTRLQVLRPGHIAALGMVRAPKQCSAGALRAACTQQLQPALPAPHTVLLMRAAGTTGNARGPQHALVDDGEELDCARIAETVDDRSEARSRLLLCWLPEVGGRLVLVLVSFSACCLTHPLSYTTRPDALAATPLTAAAARQQEEGCRQKGQGRQEGRRQLCSGSSRSRRRQLGT